MLLIKALLIIGLHKLQVLRKATWSSGTRVALAGQQQQSGVAQHADDSFETTNWLQPESLQLSSQYPK
jgi:hypothetical protein